MGTYIVTGGAGFIGSNIAKALFERGDYVIVIDNFSTGAYKNLHPKIKADQTKLYHRIKDIHSIPHCDGIFHLGIPSSTTMYRENRHLTGKTIGEFIEILEYARKHDVKIIHASTSSMYNELPFPWKEDLPIKPTDLYTEVMIAMERMARVYYDFYGQKSIALRMFSVYGDKDDNEQSKGKYGNLISQLIWAKENNVSFDSVYEEGKVWRDYTYVGDIVKAWLLAMDNKTINCDELNLGTGKTYELNEILQIIKAPYKYIPTPLVNFVKETKADTEKAEKLLGWKAETDVIQFLKERGYEK